MASNHSKSGVGTVDGYRPLIPDEHVEQIVQLRKTLSEQGGAGEGTMTVPFLGLTLNVPSQVMTPCPVSPLLGGAIFSEVNEGDRVLDMGTGSGSLALLAAGKASEVVAVDINPHAVEAVRTNAALNGVSDRVEARLSDVFSEVDGVFDLIIFNPPFQWFAARDVADSATTDEGYGTLTRFFGQVREYLAENGRMMIFFSSMGDVRYFQKLVDDGGFQQEVVFRTTRDVAGMQVEFSTHRLS